MKKITFKMWMLSAVVLAGMVSCTDSDNPVQPAQPVDPTDPEAVVDKGKWTINEEYMDPSVNPGDNFYMYCNGSYWKNTVMPAGRDIMGFMHDDIFNANEQRINALERKSLKYLKNHAFDDDKYLKEAQALMDKHLEPLINATTLEEAWEVTGKLLSEGFCTGFTITPSGKGGKMGFMIDINDGIVENLMKNSSLLSDMNEHPELLAALTPIVGRGNTRGEDATQFPMIEAWAEGMGIDPSLILTFDEMKLRVAKTDPAASLLYERMAEALEILQNSGLENYKNEIQQAVYKDLSILSEKAFEQDVDEIIAEQQSMYKEVFYVDRARDIYNKLAQYEISYEYGEKYVTPAAIDIVSSICQEQKKAFLNRISNSSWLSEASKANCTEKLNAMSFNIGKPKEWYDEGLVDLSQNTNLVEDVLLLRKARFNVCKRIAGKDIDECAFHAIIISGTPLTTINAFYMRNYNAMFIYPVFMLPPAMEEGLNEAQLYGSSTTFGHEITHGFDNIGALFDKNGDPSSIWGSEADEQEFLRRAHQLSEYFSTLEVMPEELPGVFNDGEYTLAENIADLGGLEIAFQAYKSRAQQQGLTGSELTKQLQRFFLAHANVWRCKYTSEYALKTTVGSVEDPTAKDEHSLSKERVNGSTANMDDWYTVFDVTADKKMYLPAEKRTHIW